MPIPGPLHCSYPQSLSVDDPSLIITQEPLNLTHLSSYCEYNSTLLKDDENSGVAQQL